MAWLQYAQRTLTVQRTMYILHKVNTTNVVHVCCMIDLCVYIERGNMQVDELITTLVKRSGMSYDKMSAALGKSRQYARNVAAPGRAPSIGTVADVADVAGCDVCVVDRTTGAIVATVTPPRSVKGGADA